MHAASTADDVGVSLIASARRLVETLLGMLRTRVEIVACEIEEEREHLKWLVTIGAIALAFISLGLIALTAFMTLWLWASFGIYALAMVGGVFLASGIALLLYVRYREHQRPRIFSTTLGEIAKDYDALRGRDERHPESNTTAA